MIDVGINRLPDGQLAGDVAYAECAAVAGAITPVPGGVGPDDDRLPAGEHARRRERSPGRWRSTPSPLRVTGDVAATLLLGGFRQPHHEPRAQRRCPPRRAGSRRAIRPFSASTICRLIDRPRPECWPNCSPCGRSE